MTTQSLPSIGETNWGTPLNNWLLVSREANGAIKSWDNSSRPSTPDEGTSGFNTELGILEVFNGSDWVSKSHIPTVKTLEELKGLDPINLYRGQYIQVLGYYTPGDGGGGLFWWDDSDTTTSVNTTYSGVESISITDGGSNYTIGDILYINSGTGDYAHIRVTAVSGGSIIDFELFNRGTYQSDPILGGTFANAVVTDSNASGATYSLTLHTITSGNHGLVATPSTDPINGRWIREWNKNEINIHWFGARSEDDFSGQVTNRLYNKIAMDQAVDSATANTTITCNSSYSYSISYVKTINKNLIFDFKHSKWSVQTVTEYVNSVGRGHPFLQFRGDNSFGFKFFNTATEHTEIITLTNPSDASEFVAGDYVHVRDKAVIPPALPNIGSNNNFRNEVNQIISVDDITGELKLAKSIEWPYDSNDDAQLRKFEILDNCIVKNLALCRETDSYANVFGGAETYSSQIIQFMECHTPKVIDCHFDGFNGKAIQTVRCFQAIVERCGAINGYRASEAGQGYFYQAVHCSGSIMNNCYSEKVRHHMDWSMSYDGISSNNIAFNTSAGGYMTHGTGCKRITSSNDTYHNTRPDIRKPSGWRFGNTAFGADYNITVINPRYKGFDFGIQVTTNTENVEIINPQIYSARNGILIKTGAKNVRVRGGFITAKLHSSFQSGEEFIGIYVRSAHDDSIANQNNDAIDCEDIIIDGVTIDSDNEGIRMNAVGNVVIKNCTLRGSTKQIQVGEFNRQPNCLTIANNYFQGGGDIGLEITTLPTDKFVLNNNYFTPGGFTTNAFDIITATQTVTATETVSPLGNQHPINAASSITLTQTPTISLSSEEPGRTLTLVNIGGADITFQDESILNGSKLYLGGSNFSLMPNTMLNLEFSTALDGWVKI